MKHQKVKDVNIGTLVLKHLEQSKLKNISSQLYIFHITNLLKTYQNNSLTLKLVDRIFTKLKSDTSMKATEKTMALYFTHFLRDSLNGLKSHPATGIVISCCQCGGQAKLSDSTIIYGHNNHGQVYICENYFKDCDSYVGIHQGDNLPLGELADKPTGLHGKWHMAHEVIDPLWKQKGVCRKDIYTSLADYLFVPRHKCHIGHFTVEQCKNTINYAHAMCA